MIYKLAIASFVIAQTLAAPVEDYTSKFVAWKATHGKSYQSSADEAKAFNAFSKNEDLINEHNAKGLNYQLGHNAFSDLTADEFFAQKLGYSKANINRNIIRAVSTRRRRPRSCAGSRRRSTG
jgi:hypothetical protein